MKEIQENTNPGNDNEKLRKLLEINDKNLADKEKAKNMQEKNMINIGKK